MDCQRSGSQRDIEGKCWLHGLSEEWFSEGYRGSAGSRAVRGVVLRGI
jgi:hypothetical protein